MNYQEFLQPVQRLGFINNSERADAATKAVLGILASRLEEDVAQRLTERLPEPLTLEMLRSHQKRALDTSVDEYVAEVATHCNVDLEDATQLIDTVLDCTHKTAGSERMNEIKSSLPSDWQHMIGHA